MTRAAGVAGSREGLGKPIQLEGAAWATEGAQAASFREALHDALVSEDLGQVRVRCGIARDENQTPRFLCKVEYAGDRSLEGPAAQPWSWWSPLAERPEDLVVELRRALRLRRERLSERRPTMPASAADKARGASHDTWTTAPWDIGRSVRAESFCGNRRGRWGTHAAAPRPLRPRSPRH